MKKRLILATIAAFAVSGAGAQQPSGKVLVAYFSHSGNTREVARQISEATGGDLFEIVPATPYPTEYRAVVDQGKKEIEAGVRPALKNPVGDLSQYDVIFVGSPGDVPHLLRLGGQDRRAVYDSRGQRHGTQRGRHPQTLPAVDRPRRTRRPRQRGARLEE
mgnify:CR=1 FL=1